MTKAILTEFQFHFGPIQTMKAVKEWYMYILFQFHFGPIQTYFSKNKSLINSPFQFHFGPIQTPITTSGIAKTFPVSIPLWSDSN